MARGWRIALVVIVIACLAVFSVYYYYLGERRGYRLLVYSPPAMMLLVDSVIYSYSSKYGVGVDVVYGATGSLLNKISLTNEGDVLFTADHEFMLKAMRMNLIYNDTVRVVSYVFIVMITQRGNPHNISSLNDLITQNIKIGVADPSIAPFGRLTVKLLEKNNIYEVLRDKLVIYPDTAQVARQVSMGLVDVGFVPYTIYYMFRNETELIWLKPSELPALSCQMVGVLKSSKNPDAARDFIEHTVEVVKMDEDLRRAGYLIDLNDIPRYTPYSAGELLFEDICLGLSK